MRIIKEITYKYEKAYILLKTTETRRKFISEALQEGVVFTDGSLPQLAKTDDIIMLYRNGTIAHLGWAGRVKYNNKYMVDVVIDFENLLR